MSVLMGVIILVMIYHRIQTLRHQEAMRKRKKRTIKYDKIPDPSYDEIPTRCKELEHLFAPDKRKGKR